MYGNKLFPFKMENGKLDINLTDNDFQETMMTTPRWPGETGANIYPVNILGGSVTVSAIGQNFKNYITAIYENEYDSTVWDIKVVNKGMVARAMPLSIENLGEIDTQYGDSTVEPTRDYFNWELGATYIFTRPLTISLMVNSQKRYFTLKSEICQSS
jgi:hypothetical protein